MIELAHGALRLFSKQKPKEKRRLLDFVLSNSTWKDGEMAATFRQMLLTGKEPVPHSEILEVTAIIHAAAKSLKEQSRLVKLAEMLG